MHRHNAESSFCFINRINGNTNDELQQPGEHEPTSALLDYCKRKVGVVSSLITNYLTLMSWELTNQTISRHTVPPSICGHPDPGGPQSHLHGHDQHPCLLQLRPGADGALRPACRIPLAVYLRIQVRLN